MRLLLLFLPLLVLGSGCAQHRSFTGYQGWPDWLEHVVDVFGEPDIIEDVSGDLARYREWGERQKYDWRVDEVVYYYIEKGYKITMRVEDSHDLKMTDFTDRDLELIESVLDD